MSYSALHTANTNLTKATKTTTPSAMEETTTVPSLQEIVEAIGTQVPHSANRLAFAKNIQTMIQTYPNVGFDVMAINAEAHSPFEFPRGLAITLDYDAPIQVDLMKRTPVRAFVVCDLDTCAAGDQHTELSKDYFRDPKRIEALRRCAPQFSPIPPRSLSASPEVDSWEAELGTHGWISACSSKDGVRGTRSQTRFHLAVQASAGTLDAEYYDWVKDNHSSMSIGQLADHPYTARVQDVATRNARRLAYQAARALGVTVATERDRASVFAQRGQQSRAFYAPLMAVPTNVQHSNTLDVDEKRRTVTIHSGTTQGVGTHAMVLFNPQDGFGRFTIDSGIGNEHSPEEKRIYPVGMRKETAGPNIEVYGKAPAHMIANAQCERVPDKFAPSNRYGVPTHKVISTLSNDTGQFVQYKHVALLTSDPNKARQL